MNILEQYQDAQARLYSADMIDEPYRRDREMSIWRAKLDSLSGNVALMNLHYVFDIETYPNCFVCVIKHVVTGRRWIFEVTDWRNDSAALVTFIRALGSSGATMTGFNSVGFDYVVLHHLIKIYDRQGYFLAADAKAKQRELFAAQQDQKFAHMIWDDDRVVPQLDLYKVHHFDNKAKSTSLKALEVNMRASTIGELPYDPEQPLTQEQFWKLVTYCCDDVNNTEKFYHFSFDKIKFRHELGAKLGKNFMNHNDTKIGKDYFIMELEKAGVQCFTGGAGTGQRKQPRQTHRSKIQLKDIIFPYIRFEHPEFQRVLAHMMISTIDGRETKDPPELKGLHATIRDFTFDFGGGGLHGSLKNAAVYADGEYIIYDVDVTSFYPKLAIVNRVFPEHLTEKFCDIYADLFDQRAMYAKKTAENEMLKLALNGVYGDSNNLFGCFLDPRYTMAITINGQLSLCMLAEKLMSMIGVEMLQANTDGLTIKMHRDCKPFVERMCKEWEETTGLGLEYAEYSKMFIRDVNSYLAQSVDGKVKRIGAYCHETADQNPATRELAWHKDWSALVVPKAAEAALLHGTPPSQFIAQHTDPYDFMLRAKVTGESRLELHHPYEALDKRNDAITDMTQPPAEPITGKIARYHIATSGPALVKVMPPLAKNPDKVRHIGINVGYAVNFCTIVNEFDWNRLDRSFYITETEKLIRMLKG